MKIVVTTPTGHIASALTDFLLKAGADVRLLARRPEKLQSCVDRGAKVVRGAQDDQDCLIRATREVDAMFWVTPPGYGSDDLRAYQNRMGKAAAEAIRVNRIPRVVNLSSVGAQIAWGVGPVNGLHDVEELLDKAALNITHLRPGFFFENNIWQIDAIKARGCMCLPVSGSRRLPMIATRDIARVATDVLMDSRWTGHIVRELHGPADLSFDEVAAALSEGLHRKIVHTMVGTEQARQALFEAGLSENAAEMMLELYDAIESGRLVTAQARSDETTTPTTLVEFAREIMAPMIAEPVAR